MRRSVSSHVNGTVCRLKLTGHIAWSWWWVISPLLIYIGLSVAVLVIFLGFILLGALGVGFVKAIQNDRAANRLEKEQQFSRARPLGVFDSTGEKIKERQPHSWML
jgi:hypothetical protein